MADAEVERFAPNGGHALAGAGLLVAAAMVVAWALDPRDIPLWVLAGGVLGAVLIWTSTLRPRVRVEAGDLVLRNMLDTVRIPLAAVEEVAVRQVLAVRTASHRYLCAGVGRSLRQALKGSAVASARSTSLSGLAAQAATAVEPGMHYADYIELRLRDLIAEDRRRRGVRPHSAEIEALAEEVRRERAWPELVALVAAAAFLVVAIVV